MRHDRLRDIQYPRAPKITSHLRTPKIPTLSIVHHELYNLKYKASIPSYSSKKKGKNPSPLGKKSKLNI